MAGFPPLPATQTLWRLAVLIVELHEPSCPGCVSGQHLDTRSSRLSQCS